MQIVAFGAVSALQLWQNFSPASGGVPHATHIIAFSETSFPQFLQYIVLFFVEPTHLAFRERPVFYVVAGLHLRIVISVGKLVIFPFNPEANAPIDFSLKQVRNYQGSKNWIGELRVT
jgi:hypothetical protein